MRKILKVWRDPDVGVEDRGNGEVAQRRFVA